jgi:nanoRNase/pAp phosphatase (c-di-AMP/oligoRNAs hydrolase)
MPAQAKPRATALSAFLGNGTDLLIQTHDYPDPDAIAAAFGLCRLVEHLGGRSGIIYQGEIVRAITSEMINVLKIPIIPAAAMRFDGSQRILVVDARIGNENVTKFAACYVGEIDHHQGPPAMEMPGCFVDIRPGYGSASTIIAGYYRDLDLPIERNVATALAIGLNTDTLRLIRGATPYDIEIYGYLNRHCDLAYLQYVLLNNIELKDLEFFKLAIERLAVAGSFGMVEMGRMNNPPLLAIICDFMLSLKELNVMLNLSWDEKRLFLSVRSENMDYPADRVIRTLLRQPGSGGGHRTMAAAILQLLPEEDAVELAATIRKAYFALQSAPR